MPCHLARLSLSWSRPTGSYEHKQKKFEIHTKWKWKKYYNQRDPKSRRIVLLVLTEIRVETHLRLHGRLPQQREPKLNATGTQLCHNDPLPSVTFFTPTLPVEPLKSLIKYSLFNLLPSGKCHSTRLPSSFIHQAVRMLCSCLWRFPPSASDSPASEEMIQDIPRSWDLRTR